MAKRKVTVEGLASAIEGIIKDYDNNVDNALEDVLKKTTQTARAELKAKSPKRTGEYKKGWQYSQKGMNFVIYNGTRPSLTHLLENGHALRNGGRAQAFPHIAPVEEQIVEQLPEDVVDALKRIEIRRR